MDLWPWGSWLGSFRLAGRRFRSICGLLKQANLVVDRPAGTRRVYQIHAEGFNSLREYFEQFWTRALDSFKTKVEEGS